MMMPWRRSNGSPAREGKIVSIKAMGAITLTKMWKTVSATAQV
ncbi:MAG TPA: hypothetical protein VFX24_15260 [Ktedonobacterales bacterium]|nr:hypothetical protein [Ktedonobacterales bacterium]